MGSLALPPGRRRLIAAAVAAVLLLAVVWRHAHHGSAGPPLRVAPLVGSGGAAGAAGGAGAAAGGAGAAAGGAGAAIAARAATAPASTARPIVVDVVGAVHRPGVYRLVQGDRVQDAVRRAGGLTRRADPAATNLAAPLADGEQVVVVARGSPGGVGAAPGAAGAADSSTPSAPISLSTATAEQLDTLPGVGPVTAQKIVEYRQQHGPFTSVDELDAIPGIGPSRLHDLEGLVVP